VKPTPNPRGGQIPLNPINFSPGLPTSHLWICVLAPRLTGRSCLEKSAKQIESIPQMKSVGGDRGHFALISAFGLSVLLAGALAEKFAQQESVRRGDWVLFSAAAVIAAILLGLVMANRKKSVAVGDGEITVFNLGLEDLVGSNETNKPLKSIGTLAESIRQTASEISTVTERLADAHAGGPTSDKSPGSAMRSIVDSEADTLTQLDVTNAEAAMLAEETAALNELIGASLALAETQAGHHVVHVKGLETVAGMSNHALIKAGEAALQVRALERDREALSLIGHEALTSLQQILGIVDETLIAFGDAAKNVDAETARPQEYPTKNDPAGTISQATNSIRELNDNLSKTAESIQLARMNQKFVGGHETSKTGLEEAENLTRKTRDLAAMLEVHLNREATNTHRAIKEISAELAAVQKGNLALSVKTQKLSMIAGNLGQALGHIRQGIQLEASRLEKFLSRSPMAARQTDSAMPDLMLTASKIAHNTNQLAIEGQRIQMNGNKIAGKIEDIRVTAAANRGHLHRLQQATGASGAKVEGLVKLVHGLVLSEDSATRRSTSNAARFSIQNKLALIDRFALRVIEMEANVKRMRGPSPAMDRSEMEKMPKYEFPVQ
jgi:hypothetical protein